MKLPVFLIPLITLLAGYGWISTDGFTASFPLDTEKRSISSDTVEFDQEQALEALRSEIEGKEDRPASEVFENIEVMKQVPAGRLLRIMEFGFSRSLGVTCTHCHNPDDFASEEKPQKEITRRMMAMAGTINGELLAKIENLESEKPTVNCTTCHRGQVKPALNLEE